MSTSTEHITAYPVMEHFYTLQGEGFYSGKAAYFIRLGGCDVGCVWCDVKESWDKDKHPFISIDTILSFVKQYPVDVVVITGGEPAMYDLAPLTHAMHQANMRTHIETSGAHMLSGELDWVTLSPKKFKAPLEENLTKADELKIVVYNKSDFKWAEEYAAKMREGCRLYLQPEWSKKDEMTPLIIDYVKANPKWQLSLQTHKYINIP